MKIHIVRQGETLSELANIYNVPVGRLLEVNPKLSESKKLQWGSKIRIPMGKVPVIQAQPKERKSFTSRTRKAKKKKKPSNRKVKEIEFTHSPKVSIDPDLFFLEQEEEKHPKKQRHHEKSHHPMMPFYPPSYLSFYPYSWKMHPLPHYPPTHPYEHPYDYESSSFEV